MKRLIIAIVFLVTAIGICVLENYLIKDYNREMNFYLDKMKSEFKEENYSSAVDYAKKAEEVWDNAESKLCHLTSNDTLKDIKITTARLTALAEKESDEFINEWAYAKSMLEHLVDRGKYYIY